MPVLQICFNIYIDLNEENLVFRHGLIWPHLWLAQPVALMSYHCTECGLIPILKAIGPPLWYNH